MNRFNHLHVPRQWEHYWSKYPQGYTIMEALLNWVKQVDDMVDNVNNWNDYLEDFVETFDEKLQPFVVEKLKGWLDDGTLEQVINETVFEDLNTQINTIGTDVEDLNTFQSNTFINQLSATEATKDIYVDIVQGDDENDGSETTPYRTLEKAIDMIPDVIAKGHIYTLNIKEGTYSEPAYIRDKVVLGTLIIQGTTEMSSNHKVQRLSIDNCHGNVEVKNLDGTITGGGNATFYIQKSNPVYLENVNVTGNPDTDTELTGSIGLLANNHSLVTTRDCNFSNKRYGIRANFGSKVFARECTGSGNKFGIGARFGGHVATYESNIEGYDYNESASSGGLITLEEGTIVGKHISNEPLVHYQGKDKNHKVFTINPSLSKLTTDLTAGSTLVITFARMGDGMHELNVTYGSQTSSLGGERFLYSFIGGIRDDTFYSNVETKDGNIVDTNVMLEHTGANGEFTLSITPETTSISNRYSVIIETSLLRDGEAPQIVDYEIV